MTICERCPREARYRIDLWPRLLGIPLRRRRLSVCRQCWEDLR